MENNTVKRITQQNEAIFSLHCVTFPEDQQVFALKKLELKKDTKTRVFLSFLFEFFF